MPRVRRRSRKVTPEVKQYQFVEWRRGPGNSLLAGREVGGLSRAPALCLDEETKQRSNEEMATGEITTLPSTPEDGGSGGFPPGSYKDPKRLYCKNGGFFLRIKSDGGVDGIREKSDPHSESRTVHTHTHTASLFSILLRKERQITLQKKRSLMAVNFNGCLGLLLCLKSA